MRVFLPLGFGATLAASAFGQSVPTVTLSKPQAELAEGLTRVGSIRELSDGRVLLADPRDKVLLLADWTAARPARVGREGAGPGEYALPQRLFALRADSTLLYDPANNRLLLIGPKATPGPTRPIDTGPLVGANSLRFVDSQGRLYLRTRPYGAAGEDVDEWVVRYDPASRRIDSIAQLALPRGRMEGARTLGGGMVRRINTRPLAPEDAVAFSPDGWVAVIRVTDYHVEWYPPGGRRVAGPTVPYAPIAVTAAEKTAFLKGLVVPGQITVQSDGAGRSAPRAAGALPGGGADVMDDSGMEWPARKPPFVAGGAVIAGDGRLWVERSRAHDDPVPTYDVFARDGTLVGRVVLPPKSRLVGFGRGMAYVVRLDADDLEHLQRYGY